MKREIRYLAVWLFLLLLLRLSLFLPHREIESASLLNVSLQMLLFVICIDIAIHSYKEQKHVYAFFAFFFVCSLLLFGSSFVGAFLFQGSLYSSVYYHVYVNKFGLNFILLFSVVFVLVDYVTRLQKIMLKYAMSLAVALLIMLPLYSSFLLKPLQLYYEDEYAALFKMSQANTSFIEQHSRAPSNIELAKLIVTHNDAGENNSTGEFARAEKTVASLRAYMNEGGMTAIFWKPLDLNSIYINIIIVVLLSIFFISNYIFNKPHSAYLDKILVLFLLLCLVDIVHVFAYISSSTLAIYHSIFAVAQYVTIICLVLMVYAFDLRLRFVLSATGKYYEEVLQSTPEKVTRWRDEVDNVILKSFFNIKKYNKHLGHYSDK